MMLTNSFSLLGLLLLSGTTSASPLDILARAPAASSHNLYLVTCTPPNGRWGNSNTKIGGIAYFDAPIQQTTGGTSRPNQTAIISNPATAWENNKQQTTVWNNAVFSADIAQGAGTLAKGQIAGGANLGTEEFICFKDGVTTIGFNGGYGNGGGWGPGGPWGNNPGWHNPGWRNPPNNGQQGDVNAWIDCTADYWCGSLA